MLSDGGGGVPNLWEADGAAGDGEFLIGPACDDDGIGGGEDFAFDVAFEVEVFFAFGGDEESRATDGGGGGVAGLSDVKSCATADCSSDLP